jgi:hypothetical protein
MPQSMGGIKMNEVIVFHGGTDIVKVPICKFGRKNLDFGQGFYVTTVKEQAERWARRKAGLRKGKPAIVNCYQMADDFGNLKYKTFPEDLMEWIDFVCKCRDGNTEYKDYDLISGKVANDKVFRVVDLYHTGIWDKERALKEIKVYPNYDQIAFITQRAIDKMLIYDSCFEV